MLQNGPKRILETTQFVVKVNFIFHFSLNQPSGTISIETDALSCSVCYLVLQKCVFGELRQNFLLERSGERLFLRLEY